VGNVRDEDGTHASHNVPGTPYDEDLPYLEAWVRERMQGEPVTIEKPEADALIRQYQETARIRNWSLEAASVMFNHTHLIVGVPGDPDPQHVMESFKSWATRDVKKLRPLPPGGTFWTAKGSKRKLPDEAAVRGAVVYVAKKQPDALAVWSASRWQQVLEEYEVSRASRGA
jgi:REP element-mobilizing transposase RayT